MNNGTSTPWWANSASESLMNLGPIVIGFLILLLIVMGVIPSGLSKAIAQHETILQQNEALSDAVVQQVGLLKKICINTASNDEARRDCIK